MRFVVLMWTGSRDFLQTQLNELMLRGLYCNGQTEPLDFLCK